MKYIINNIVQYNSLDGSLFNPEYSVDMITLSRISNELLFLFIQNVRALLSRDEILNELWEKRGLSASNNNLNNHISILRKALLECGCSGIIKTVPKHGFVFDAEIVAIASAKGSGINKKVDIDENIQTTEISKGYNTTNKKWTLAPWLKKIFLLIVAAVAAVVTYTVYEHFRINAVRNEIFRIRECRFYLIDDLTRRMSHDWVVSRVKLIVSNEHIDCEMQANVYYSADRKQDSTGNYMLHDFLSYCPYNSKAPCENYTYTRAEGKYEKNK